jgi:hypothetical protein
MEKIILVFCVCSLINVILSTLKTLIMVNCGEKMAIFINAICYGFYTLVVKQLTSVDYITAVVVTILANIVGVWISYRIMNMFHIDKLWKIEATFKYSVDFLESLELWHKQYNVPYNYIDIGKYYVVNFFAETQKDSLAVKEFIEYFDGKYFASETKKL